MLSFIYPSWETPLYLAKSLEITAKMHSSTVHYCYVTAVDPWTHQSNKHQRKLTTDWQFISGMLRTMMSSPRLRFKKALKHMLHFKHVPNTLLSAFLNRVIIDSVTTDH